MKPNRVVFYWTGLFIFVFLSVGSHMVGGRGPQEPKQVLSIPQASVIPSPTDRVIIGNQSENYAIRWYKPQDLEKIRGVALVIHGLNLRPDKMQAIISGLTHSGIEVLRLSLRGHGDNYTHQDGITEDQARLETFKSVSFPLWMNEAFLAYTEAQKRSAAIKVPLCFVGFSVGGLIGLDLFLSQDDVHFDRMVLFAPAIKLHSFHYLARLLSPFSRLVIPSLSPDSYLSNKKGTPIAAYNALFEGLQQFENLVSRKINVPSLIFIDENDEFIPLRALKDLIQEQELSRWELHIVEKEAAARQNSFHHHIIDAPSTGPTVWKNIMQSTLNFLLANGPS